MALFRNSPKAAEKESVNTYWYRDDQSKSCLYINDKPCNVGTRSIMQMSFSDENIWIAPCFNDRSKNACLQLRSEIKKLGFSVSDDVHPLVVDYNITSCVLNLIMFIDKTEKLSEEVKAEIWTRAQSYAARAKRRPGP